MTKILLACAGGLSTSMVMKKMEEAAKKKGVEIDVDATAISAIKKSIDGVDALLLGPQMGHKKQEMVKLYGDKVKVIMVMDMLDYGRMNGEAILTKTLSELEGK